MITDFRQEFMADAALLALADYDRQRARTPELPAMRGIPDLGPLMEGGLGVAALEEERLVGYLLCWGPFQNAFRSTDAVGVWSPVHANAAIPENRAAVYAALYRAAAGKWARAGAASHGIGLYAWDAEAQALFFRHGFGMRTADGIREMDELSAPVPEGFTFRRLAPDECLLALPLVRMLDAHMAESPTFMARPSETQAAFLEGAARPETRYYTAFRGGQIAAYIKIEREGETFITGEPDYIHITGAYCLPEYRGAFVVQNLINCAVRELRAAGYARLGVDFESINPAAHRFWGKYFGIYTCGVVRRIDEYALSRSPFWGHDC
jgi:ribosomal protein S18 acetylase RimI-like enzyme